MVGTVQLDIDTDVFIAEMRLIKAAIAAAEHPETQSVRAELRAAVNQYQTASRIADLKQKNADALNP